MAVSLYHHSANIDRARMRQLTGQPGGLHAASPRPSLREWVLEWISAAVAPRDELDSMPGVMLHLSDAWARRERRGVVLVHYDDLSADLDGEMRRLAGLLGIAVPEGTWPALVAAATFDRMRARADRLVPAPPGVLMDNAAFFRRGTSGSGRALLTSDERARYRAGAAQMAPADLLRWLHRETG